MDKLLETERLFIRKFQLSDAPFMLELLNTEEWKKYIGDRNVHTLTEAENYLLKGALRYDELNGISFYAVCLKESEKVIGTCGFVKRDFLENLDFGFAFLPAYFGRGYAFESSKAMLDFGIKTWNLKQVVAIALHENEASLKLLVKLGFDYEKDVALENPPEVLALYIHTPTK